MNNFKYGSGEKCPPNRQSLNSKLRGRRGLRIGGLRTMRSPLLPPACLQLDPLKLKMATWSAERRHTGLIRASDILNTTMV